MKRFDFRLKSVLVLRKRLLNDAERKYALAIQRRKNAETNLQEGMIELNVMNERVMRTREARFSGYQQEVYIRGLKQAKTNLVKLEKILAQARKLEAQEKMVYIEANKNHELLLKLKDRQLMKHVFDEQQKEQLEQDDLFNARKSILNAAR